MEKNNAITMTIVKKGDKTYHNFYLFGVLVNPYDKKNYSKLYTSVKVYCELMNIEVPVVTLDEKEVTKDEKKSK